jgi:hypothetical protein
MKNIPVIFVHKNNIKSDSSYVEYSLRQALKHNTVVYISDLDVNIIHPDLKKINLELTDDCKKLADTYVHMSTNSHEFELFAMLRHFIMLNYMSNNNIDEIFHCDSDCLLFTDVNREYENTFKNYKLSLTLGGCGATSYMTKYALESITNEMLYTYSNKDKNPYKWFVKVYNTKQEKKQGGGISDMNFLSHFNNKHKEDVFEMSNVINNQTWDTRIDKAYNNEYIIKNGIKDVTYFNNLPHVFNTILNTYVRFKSLHFQGARKSLLQTHYSLLTDS